MESTNRARIYFTSWDDSEQFVSRTFHDSIGTCESSSFYFRICWTLSWQSHSYCNKFLTFRFKLRCTSFLHKTNKSAKLSKCNDLFLLKVEIEEPFDKMLFLCHRHHLLHCNININSAKRLLSQHRTTRYTNQKSFATAIDFCWIANSSDVDCTHRVYLLDNYMLEVHCVWEHVPTVLFYFFLSHEWLCFMCIFTQRETVRCSDNKKLKIWKNISIMFG